MGSKCFNKIALFVPALRGGGAQRVMLILAAKFIEKDIQVDLVLSNAIGPYLDDVPNGVRVINLNSRRVLTSMPRLIAYLKKEKPAVMLSTMGHANIIAVWAKKFSGVTTKLFVRVENTVSVNLQEKGVIRACLLKYLIRFTYAQADGVIAPSQGVADDLVRNIGVSDNLIHVVFNPVLRPEIRVKAKQKVEHQWIGPDKSLPLILSAGRLTQQKDYQILIRAFEIVNRHHPAQLLILGEGEERFMLEKLITNLGLDNSVDLHGFVDNPYAYMAHATVFVLSSKWEGLPNALIEAMATGAPVVSTDCKSGPREILDGGKYGELVPVGDVDAMAKAILNVIEKRNTACETTEWLKKFTQDNCIDNYLKVMQAS